MRIAILTFHCCCNFGAVLQAYGLKTFLEKLGCKVDIIDYRPKFLTSPYRAFQFKSSSASGLRATIKWHIRQLMCIGIRLNRLNQFKSFISKHLQPVKCNLAKTNNLYDAFVFGSDQIWNPAISSGLDRIYFGDFKAAENKLRIAYGASAGSIDYLKELDEFFVLSKKLNYIGVREKLLISFFKQHNYNQPLDQVIDPVLLCGKEPFDRMARKQNERLPYVLIFQLDSNEELEKLASEYAEISSAQLIRIDSQTIPLKAKNALLSPSVPEFLSLFKHASYVFTSTYHGVVFSLLFERDFSFYNADIHKRDRIYDLLDRLNIPERQILNPVQPPVYSEIDYNSVNARIEQFRSVSIGFLKRSLNLNPV